MTRDDVIRMARETGFWISDDGDLSGGNNCFGLLDFAALVAAAEREACAAWVADTDAEDWAYLSPEQLATAIRARGEK